MGSSDVVELPAATKPLSREDIEKSFFSGVYPAGTVVEITFVGKSTDDVLCLISMFCEEIIDASLETIERLINIHSLCDWGGEENKTVRVTLTKNFRIDWFSGKLEDIINKIDLIEYDLLSKPLR